MKITFHNFDNTIFSGFYCSILDVGELEYANNQVETQEGCPEREIPCGEGYTKFCSKVAENHVDNILQELYDHSIIKDIKYISLYMPHYYNYETDRIEMQVDFNARALEKYCYKEKFFEFSEYLKNHYTSYDGFMSFVPNRIIEFKDFKKENAHNYWEVMIEFYLTNTINFDTVHASTWEFENQLWWTDSVEISVA